MLKCKVLTMVPLKERYMQPAEYEYNPK